MNTHLNITLNDLMQFLEINTASKTICPQGTVVLQNEFKNKTKNITFSKVSEKDLTLTSHRF